MGNIVITGASSEIGQAIATKMIDFGQPLLLQCNSNKSTLSEFEDKAEIVVADFTQKNQINDFIGKLQNTDILINAAAFTSTGLVPMLEEENIEKMIQVNIMALIRICKAVIPMMCVRRKGIIVNISSITAQKVYRGQSVYGGTKAFTELFSKSIATEYGKKGIRSNCVAPGAIDAGSLKALKAIGESEILASNAMAKMGAPADVANAVAFLCRPESNFINGTVLHVDGGYWIGM